jgi:membrane carboxypeptidase/penicillin-binding protein
MRKIFLVCLSLIAVLGVLVFLYLFVGIPGTNELKTFNPFQPAIVFDVCSGETIQVIPFSDFPKSLGDALSVAEPIPSRYAQVARYSLCNSRRRAGRYALDSYRLSQKLRFRFSVNEIQTIYLNRVYLGNDTHGIESGSLLYAHKHAKDLNLSESALLVGMIRSPARYSPSKYPDAAKARRNQVLDLMLGQNLISTQDAERAKAEPLPAN